MQVKLLAVNGGHIVETTLGIVDSGADRSNFPADWAEPLGIDLDADCDEQDGDTAGGPVVQKVYEPGLDALVFGRKVHLDAVFQERLPVVLLGREDFFNEYKVAFNQRRLTFRVDSYQ